MKRSMLTNIKVLQDYNNMQLVEYVPYGAIEDGDYNHKLYAIINNYKGQKYWDEGAEIFVSKSNALEQFAKYTSKVKEINVLWNTVNKVGNLKFKGKCDIIGKNKTKLFTATFYCIPSKEVVLFDEDTQNKLSEKDVELAENILLDEILDTLSNNDLDSLKKYNYDDIKEELEENLNKFFHGDEDILDYSGIQFNFENGSAKFTVYAEVGYNTLSKLCDVLDIIIQKYDKDAYFEPETSGRAVAYL